MSMQTYRGYADAGMAALAQFYDPNAGLWSNEWWNSASTLETTIEYCIRANSLTYFDCIAKTFDNAANSSGNTNFKNNFYDDEGWWALAWIKAYDFTGKGDYLDKAKDVFEDMTHGWDQAFNGGLWWNKSHEKKNAIPNELFFAIAAKLHLRTPGGGDGSYLNWAQNAWNWFRGTGMINGDNLVNDGLDGGHTFTYNQGVILSGLVDLYQITNDESLLQQAMRIADATISKLVDPQGNGILHEPGDTPGNDDGPQFKGVFMRNLHYLYQTTGKSGYADFITTNADSIWSTSRSEQNQFGFLWEGPFDKASLARQSSALDAINAAIACSYDGTTLQAEDATLHALSTENTNRGHHGDGYVAGWVHDGQWVDFQVEVDSDGKYDLVWRYSAGNGRAVRFLFVNGASVYDQLSFPNTGCWTTWNTVVSTNVPLKSGSNTVSLIFDPGKGSSNFLNLDEMSIDGA